MKLATPAKSTTTPSLSLPIDRPEPQAHISLDHVPLYQRVDGKTDSHHYYYTHFYQDRIVTCQKSLEERERSEKQVQNEENLSRGQYNGYMSPKAARRVRKFLMSWHKSAEQYKELEKSKYEIAEAYITFATLTLPMAQKHSDTEIKRKILIPFIEKLGRTYNVKHYYWRAEPQVNGNIHFHLLIDKYIANNWLQNEWNVSCDKLGYLESYFAETGSLFPPSTEIHRPPDANRVARYVTDYVTKAPKKIKSIMPGEKERIVSSVMVGEHKSWQGSEKYYKYRKLEGRVWGASAELKRLNVFSQAESRRVQRISWIAEKMNKTEVYKDEYFKVVKVDVEALLKQYDHELYLRYVEFYSNQFHALYDEKEAEWEPPKMDKKERDREKVDDRKMGKQSSLFEGWNSSLN